MAFFIVFEGGEGSGKTTQAEKLHSALANRNIAVRLVYEPGGTALGEALRPLMVTPRGPLCPEAELFLFEASRAQLVAEVIRPSLQNGISIICDRFIYSTVAYQGFGRGLDIRLIEHLNEVATQGLRPDLVIFLDMPPAAGLRRKTKATEISRFEEEEVAFHQRVREGYLKQATADSQRWFVVDALLPKAQVSDIIWARVEKLLTASFPLLG